MEGFEAATYGDRFADVYDHWYPSGTHTIAAVDRLVELSQSVPQGTGSGVVIELGVGTGSVAIPLARRGFDVRGIDASAAMIARLRSLDPANSVATNVADFTHFDAKQLPRRPEDSGGRLAVGLVFITSNTLFVVPGSLARVALFRRIADVLRPTVGRFVFEAFVPPSADGTDDGTEVSATTAADTAVTIRSLTADRVVLTAARRDRVARTITGQFIDLGHGETVHLRPFHLHEATPEELDDELGQAGMRLEQRTADWSGSPFTAASDNHVSVYVGDL